LSLLKKLIALFTQKLSKFKVLEARLQYIFTNKYYLEKALTHRSFQHHSLGNYERLEFVGDSIIDQTVSLYLFKKYPNSDEGTLTKKRSTLVNREFLSIMGRNLQVIDVVRTDSSVNIKDPKVATKISADVYEAIVGAIYFDGGYKHASKFIKRTLFKAEDLSLEDQNYKGQLIECCHCNGLSAPQFSITDSHGPEHEKTFVVNVTILPNKTWEGIGSTKKSAEQNCAQKAMNTLLGS